MIESFTEISEKTENAENEITNLLENKQAPKCASGLVMLLEFWFQLIR